MLFSGGAARGAKLLLRRHQCHRTGQGQEKAQGEVGAVLASCLLGRRTGQGPATDGMIAGLRGLEDDTFHGRRK